MVSIVLHVGLNPDSMSLVHDMLENPHKDSWSSKVHVVPACGLYLDNIHYNPAYMDLDADPPESVMEYYRLLKEKNMLNDEVPSDDEQAEEDTEVLRGETSGG